LVPGKADLNVVSCATGTIHRFLFIVDVGIPVYAYTYTNCLLLEGLRKESEAGWIPYDAGPLLEY
jgi:hypothetical protein